MKHLVYGLTYATVTAVSAAFHNILIVGNLLLKDFFFACANKEIGKSFQTL